MAAGAVTARRVGRGRGSPGGRSRCAGPRSPPLRPAAPPARSRCAARGCCPASRGAAAAPRRVGQRAAPRRPAAAPPRRANRRASGTISAVRSRSGGHDRGERAQPEEQVPPEPPLGDVGVRDRGWWPPRSARRSAGSSRCPRAHLPGLQHVQQLGLDAAAAARPPRPGTRCRPRRSPAGRAWTAPPR